MKHLRQSAAACLAIVGMLLCPARTPAQATDSPAPAPKSATPKAAASKTVAPQASDEPGAAPPPAPTPTQVPMNRMVVVLDAAHGGRDSGSRIGDGTIEKDVTLALAFKLRSLLAARGFAVVMTRDADAATEPNPAGAALTLDDRAGIANHARGVACLLLHATGGGNGVHLYTSELAATALEAAAQPWLTAQSAWVTQSRNLGSQIANALTRSGIPLVVNTASVRPVDSLTCPAVVVEVAPQDDDPKSVTDGDYQQRIAQSLAGALLAWRDQAQAPVRSFATAPIAARSSDGPSAGASMPKGRQP